MANTKLSAFPTVTSVGPTDSVGLVQAGVTSKATATLVRGYLTNGSTANQTGFAADQYLAGSSITIPTAGGWKASTIYKCWFDMAKTAAGTASIVVTLRMGTLGTTGDAAIIGAGAWTFSVGTAAADTGIFTVQAVFRTVGGGTAAVVQGVLSLNHQLVSTGLASTGTSTGFIVLPGTSAGFNSTTQTVIGVSVNGGASFAGTNTLVCAELQGF